jgi:hypothetical protein
MLRAGAACGVSSAWLIALCLCVLLCDTGVTLVRFEWCTEGLEEGSGSSKRASFELFDAFHLKYSRIAPAFARHVFALCISFGVTGMCMIVISTR